MSRGLWLPGVPCNSPEARTWSLHVLDAAEPVPLLSDSNNAITLVPGYLKVHHECFLPTSTNFGSRAPIPGDTWT